MDREYKGKLQLYGGKYCIVLTGDMHKYITTKFKGTHEYSEEELEDFKRGMITALFYLDENPSSKKPEDSRTYYLLFGEQPAIHHIVHEVIHWKNEIARYHGLVYPTNEDEHEAYLVDYLTRLIISKIYKEYKFLYK